jgi:hypothetical protein
VRYYVSPADKLIHQVIKGEDVTRPRAFAILRDIQINGPKDSAAFAYMLPSNAEPAQMPTTFALPVQK